MILLQSKRTSSSLNVKDRLGKSGIVIEINKFPTVQKVFTILSVSSPLQFLKSKQWPLPLGRRGFFDERFPRLPFDHLPCEIEFFFGLADEFFRLTAIDLGLERLQVRAVGVDQVQTLGDDAGGVLAIGRLGRHLVQHAEDLAVQHPQLRGAIGMYRQTRQSRRHFHPVAQSRHEHHFSCQALSLVGTFSVVFR